MKKSLFLFLLLSLCACGFELKTVRLRQYAEELGEHRIVLDENGEILPWNNDTLGVAYEDIIMRLWNFWDTMRIDYNGLPYYMNHLVWRSDFNDARGMGGDQFAMMLSSWQLLYQYSGNERVKDNMRFIADYYLSHSLSPLDCQWPNLPFPYATLVYSGHFDGDMILGKGYTQPDKAGSFGWELVKLYRMTGERLYLEHAEAIAQTLCKQVRCGDENHSPWPFKVNVFTGEAGALKGEDWSGESLGASEYTTAYAPTLELLLALAERNTPQKDRYREVAEEVIRWMCDYPLQNNKWGPFFEDVPGWSDTQINAVSFARFMMLHSNYFPQWKEQVNNLFAWVYQELGNPKWEKYGVTAINEQTAYRVPGNSHTARQASAELLYVHLSGDSTRYEPALRKLNWATYMVNERGENCYPQDAIWFTDGYGDYVRHYLRALNLCPELGHPTGNHLLTTTSTIQQIDYAPHLNKFLISTVDPSTVNRTLLYYKTADSTGVESIRLLQKPQQLHMEWKGVDSTTTQGNYWKWEPLCNGGGLLHVYRNNARNVSIEIE